MIMAKNEIGKFSSRECCSMVLLLGGGWNGVAVDAKGEPGDGALKILNGGLD
jgi:hypothetical protein